MICKYRTHGQTYMNLDDSPKAIYACRYYVFGLRKTKMGVDTMSTVLVMAIRNIVNEDMRRFFG
jgi:hypothetical protein